MSAKVVSFEMNERTPGTMWPALRILEYRRMAEMLAVQPCPEHARLLDGACEVDAHRAEDPDLSGYSEMDQSAHLIIMHIVKFHRPSQKEQPEAWVQKASATLKLIRDYLATRTNR